MKGIHVDCPSCKRKLFKDTYLRIGSYLTTKCFYCGATISVLSEQGKITIRVLVQPVEKSELTDEDEDGILMLHV